MTLNVRGGSVKRGVKFVLVFVGLAVVISLAGVALMFMAMSSGPSVPSAATLVLRPGGEIQEVVPDDVFGLLGRGTNTVRGFVEGLDKAKRDPRIKAVLLMPSGLSTPYWAKLQELRDAVIDFKKSRKTVIAFLEYGGDREYYLASAADKVYLLPTSSLDLTGVASYEIFLRGLLDKIGAVPDYLHVGAYKTAVNQMTEKGFTPAHREMSESLNRDMYDQLIRGIAEARKKSEQEVRALIDQGPFTPEDALRHGFVDELAYEDQLDDRVPALRSGSRETRRIEGSDYQRIRAGSVGIRPRSRIAVIYAAGTIVSGRSAYDPLNGAVVGSDSLVEQIREVRDDNSLKAIILRVDSPGGSSVASDVIWRELMITRDKNPSRPLIASMSDLAASGGYYISLPAQVIVAQPATLTGSIGVYAGKIALGGTLSKVGVTTETVTSGANSDIYSPFTPFSPSHRARLQDQMQGFYENFVEKVAESRKTTPEKIDAVAQGRVWTGRQARERGLVDALGGLDVAVRIAKERAHIPADEDVQLVAYPARRSLYETIAGSFGVRMNVWSLLAGGAEQHAVSALTAPARLFRRGEPLTLMPYVFVR
jgi:protease-4